MSDRIAAFEGRFGYRFHNRQRLDTALTHASTGADHNYERLEFLGDRVLGLVVAELLYEDFPHETEGDLARRHAALVSGATLAVIADNIELGAVLRLSDSERATGGAKNDNILSDVMEALIGALYLDAGIGPCKTVIGTLWRDILHTMEKPPQDPKTALQEWAQARGLKLPRYDLAARTGPDHAPVFTMTVSIDGFAPVSGDGPSRRAAEKAAAISMLSLIAGSSS
jgi:ribonuclease-3